MNLSHRCGGTFRRLYARESRTAGNANQAFRPFPALGCDRCGAVKKMPKEPRRG